MTIRSIMEDALRYPLSDWKKILILGILLIISQLYSFKNNSSFIIFSIVIIFVTYIFSQGYQFRIIKSSLNGMDELPKFNNWVDMFKDGVKVFVISNVYLIPFIILALFMSNSLDSLVILTNNPLFDFISFSEGLFRVVMLGNLTTLVTKTGYWSFVAILYSLTIIPIYFMALANMANHKSKLKAGFKLMEIFQKIKNIGLKNIIIFYIVLIIPFSIVKILNTNLIELILILLVIAPYLRMYMNRLVALLYM